MIKLLKLLCFFLAWSISVLSVYLWATTDVNMIYDVYIILSLILSMLYLMFNHMK